MSFKHRNVQKKFNSTRNRVFAFNVIVRLNCSKRRDVSSKIEKGKRNWKKKKTDIYFFYKRQNLKIRVRLFFSSLFFVFALITLWLKISNIYWNHLFAHHLFVYYLSIYYLFVHHLSTYHSFDTLNNRWNFHRNYLFDAANIRDDFHRNYLFNTLNIHKDRIKYSIRFLSYQLFISSLTCR